MKRRSIFTLLLITISIFSKAQVSPELQDAWKQVKLDLQRKNKVLGDLIPLIKQGKSADWKMLEEIKIIHDHLDLRLRQNNLDSRETTTIADLNSQLEQRLSKVMETSMKDTNLAEMDNFPDLQAQLEGTMNRLNVSVQRYNDIVKKLGRKDIHFEIGNRKSTPPKVEF